MAKCVFCGEKAARGKTIVIGDMSLSCCEICHEHFSDMDREDIARAVLDAGGRGLQKVARGPRRRDLPQVRRCHDKGRSGELPFYRRDRPYSAVEHIQYRYLQICPGKL